VNFLKFVLILSSDVYKKILLKTLSSVALARATTILLTIREITPMKTYNFRIK